MSETENRPADNRPHLADVAVPVAVRTPFTYLVPEALRGAVEIGHRVPIPLGRRSTHGYVVRVHGGAAPEKVRAISGPPDPPEPVFDRKLLELTRWISDYYLAPWGEVLEAAAPRGRLPRRRRGKENPADNPEEGPTGQDPSRTGHDNAEESRGAAGDPSAVGPGVLAAQQEPQPSLEPEQLEVYERLRASVLARRFAVHLLRGVPGSGKTEIYLSLARDVIRDGGSVLLLEPEIGIATQILARVRRRFGDLAGLYHSMTGGAERRRTWERARSGELRIVVGARSAVFVPMKDLRLVVIDEEQEPAYKQEESPRYSGRDTAIMRARLTNAAVVLGSATPSLEAWWNARAGKFAPEILTRRFASREPARVSVVDLRRDPGIERGTRVIPLFSGLLVQKIRARLQAGEQTLLFLNRRGHSTVVQCCDCGEMFRCTQCDVVLTYHRTTGDLRCHHCGLVLRNPESCPACKGAYLYYGGIGTQKLEEKMAELFPSARLLRIDADSTRRRGSHAAHLASIEKGSVDIMLGTQMLAKGFDFPGVTLVGVLLADREMGLPELRASERAYQVLTQVAGRAGRGPIPGEVVIQTLLPDHHVIRSAAAGDFDSFAEAEIRYRRAQRDPPFTRMIHLLFDGTVEKTVERRAVDTVMTLDAAARREGITILGPAPMFLSRLKGRYRWHLSLKGTRSDALHALARQAIDHTPPPGTRGVRLHVDVDPVHTL